MSQYKSVNILVQRLIWQEQLAKFLIVFQNQVTSRSNTPSRANTCRGPRHVFAQMRFRRVENLLNEKLS